MPELFTDPFVSFCVCVRVCLGVEMTYVTHVEMWSSVLAEHPLAASLFLSVFDFILSFSPSSEQVIWSVFLFTYLTS